jgi:two-component system phosphate regulon sensor histidine kinase PhoR
MTPPDTDRQAREFQGFVHLLEDLGNAAERTFSRFFGVIAARDKVVVDAQALERYKAKADLIQQRAHLQTLEIARLTGILAEIDEGVIMQGPDGRILLMNEAARHLLGSTKQLWQSELGQFFREAHGLAPVESQMQMVGERQRVTLNDRVLAVRLAAINDKDGLPLGTVMLLRDVSSAVVSERLKDSFIAQMSHELRTPLTAIKGASEVLLNTPEGKPPKRSMLEAINRNVATLDRMVVELLDISEITSGSFEILPAPLQLDDLAFNVLKGFEPSMNQQHLFSTSMITNPRALHIQGDLRRLQWAVGHLVDNAIKYTLPGGDITLQLGKVRGGRVLLEVSDTGVGINSQDLPRIFERFYRGQPRTPDGRVLDPRGVGQGLFIAEAVVAAHGGVISVASSEGQGSTFTVELPMSA